MESFLEFLVSKKSLQLSFLLPLLLLVFYQLLGCREISSLRLTLKCLSVTTAYPGASPEDVEKKVTNIIEDELLGVSGIKEITSSSREGTFIDYCYT